jgi:hypothetical protein
MCTIWPTHICCGFGCLVVTNRQRNQTKQTNKQANTWFSKSKVTNILMAINLFCLRCVRGIWAAEGTCHTSTCSPLTDKHLSRNGTKACIPEYKKSMSTVYPGSDSLLHIGVCCKSLTTQVLVKRLTEMENTATHAPNRTWDWCGPTKSVLWTTILRVLMSCPLLSNIWSP